MGYLLKSYAKMYDWAIFLGKKIGKQDLLSDQNNLTKGRLRRIFWDNGRMLTVVTIQHDEDIELPGFIDRWWQYAFFNAWRGHEARALADIEFMRDL